MVSYLVRTHYHPTPVLHLPHAYRFCYRRLGSRKPARVLVAYDVVLGAIIVIAITACIIPGITISVRSEKA
jgi:hypothetical protein